MDGEVTDSDQEFEAIVTLDSLLSSLLDFHNSHVRDADAVTSAHKSIIELAQKVKQLNELVEFTNADLW